MARHILDGTGSDMAGLGPGCKGAMEAENTHMRVVYESETVGFVERAVSVLGGSADSASFEHYVTERVVEAGLCASGGCRFYVMLASDSDLAYVGLIKF